MELWKQVSVRERERERERERKRSVIGRNFIYRVSPRRVAVVGLKSWWLYVVTMGREGVHPHPLFSFLPLSVFPPVNNRGLAEGWGLRKSDRGGV